MTFRRNVQIIQKLPKDVGLIEKPTKEIRKRQEQARKAEEHQNFWDHSQVPAKCYMVIFSVLHIRAVSRDTGVEVRFSRHRG